MMGRFIENPNLPKQNVSHMLLSNCNYNIVGALSSFGIRCIYSEKCKTFISAECEHSDMQCIHLGVDNVIVLQECVTLASSLGDEGFNVYQAMRTVKSDYPDNVLLNACIVGDNIICRQKSTDESIFKLLPNHNIINVNQGYAKCSIAVISDNAVITSDNGIYNTLQHSNIDCLKITQGHIILPGVDYGFIGGCSGKISKDIVVFTGKIEAHPDYENIKAFMRNYNVYYESLTNDCLFDIGGLLPLKERIN